MPRLAAALLVAGALVPLAACASENPEGREPASTPSAAARDTGERVPATPRGLAAGALTHLPVPATYFSGAADGEVLDVMIGTDSPGVEAVFVFVRTAPGVAAVPCGSDFGYESISCRREAGSRVEVLRRRSATGDAADVMGRVQTPSRKDVLIEVWGSDDEATEALVRDLLADPLVGAVTTPALNEAGEDLPEFEKPEIEQRIETAG